MPARNLQLAIIIGSTREGRWGDKVAHWFAGEARRRPDLLVDVIDLAEVDIPAVLPMRHTPDVQVYAERIDRADAFVVVTPEYNHSYPASLKQAIDVLNAPWRRKPVAFVSYGGLSGGLRAVEHLRQVFAELHATTIRETVILHRHPLLFDDSGALVESSGPAEATKVMLDDLVWWASALRTARDAEVADLAWIE
jgi:NAD(P)H-dependent FMN reductase